LSDQLSPGNNFPLLPPPPSCFPIIFSKSTHTITLSLSLSLSLFYRDVGAVVLKVLTAKAVQRLLTMLGEYDLLQQNWFHQYCAEHPPTTGNKFIDELMQAKGEVIHDATTQTDHAVDPQNLAHRILQMRADMADRLVTGMIKYTEVENMSVLKKHLERATYMSGSHEQGGEQGKSRRGYYQSRRSGI
jgi:hypothetical protein